MATPSKAYKYIGIVKSAGDFVLEYSEYQRALGNPCWYIGRGSVPGNTTPIPSGLHSTPRLAWKAAAIALGLAKAVTK